MVRATPRRVMPRPSMFAQDAGGTPKTAAPITGTAKGALSLAADAALAASWLLDATTLANQALESSSKKTYEATYAEYKAFVQLQGYTGPVSVNSITAFLKTKCQAVKNAASYALWLTHVTHGARRDGTLTTLSHEDRLLLKQHKRACGKLFGEVHSQAREWGLTEVQAFAACAPSPEKDLQEYAIYVQAIVAANTLARPEDFCGPQCVTQVRHVTFLPATDELPFGGFSIALENSKKQRKTGLRGEECLLGYGTGDASCPVRHLKRFFKAYRLESTPGAPLFAKMRRDGSRYIDLTTGLAVRLSLAQYNGGLARLCERAGIPTITARGSRAGGRTDLGADGVLDSIATTMGRWSQVQNGRPYSRQSPRILHHVIKARGIKRTAHAAAAAQAPPGGAAPAAKRRRV